MSCPTPDGGSQRCPAAGRAGSCRHAPAGAARSCPDADGIDARMGRRRARSEEPAAESQRPRRRRIPQPSPRQQPAPMEKNQQAMARSNMQKDVALTSRTKHCGKPEVARNRASTARLVKLYKDMSPEQRKMIEKAGLGGLLKIGTYTLPIELINWLLRNLDAESNEPVIPGRGTIKVTAESVDRILGLSKNGGKVMYDFNVEAINFIHEKYQVENGKAP